MSEHICDECDREFKEEISLEAHKKDRHPSSESTEEEVEKKVEVTKEEKPKKRTNGKTISIKGWMIAVAIILIIAAFIYLKPILGAYIKVLPPTDFSGHIEINPVSHVLKKPMDIRTQKHMIEHADGKDVPGVIINYNCKDYECPEDLISNLEAFAEKYPVNVYVAPFKNMDGMIVLTKYGKLDVLEEYDPQKIEIFINGGF